MLSGEDVWNNFLSQKRYTVHIDRYDVWNDLMTILNFAIQMQNQKLILYMLRPLREYDTCLSSLILALATPTCRNLYNKEVCYIENIEDFDEIKLRYSKIDQLMHANMVRKFAGKCKNPFSSNNFGRMSVERRSSSATIAATAILTLWSHSD